MRIINLLLVTVYCLMACLLFACAHQNIYEQIPHIGDKMPCDADPESGRIISSAQISSGCYKDIDGIKFYFAPGSSFVSANDSIFYISTNDPKFKTPEGIHVGSTWKDVKEIVGGELDWKSGCMSSKQSGRTWL
jgi:hypothetical protein